MFPPQSPTDSCITTEFRRFVAKIWVTHNFNNFGTLKWMQETQIQNAKDRSKCEP